MARRRIGPTRLATGRRTPDVPCNTPSVPLARKRADTLSLSGTSSCASKVGRMSAICYDAFVVHPGAFDPPASIVKRRRQEWRVLRGRWSETIGAYPDVQWVLGTRRAAEPRSGASLHFSQRLQALSAEWTPALYLALPANVIRFSNQSALGML